MVFCLLTGVGGVAELLSAFLIFAFVLFATYLTARIVGSFEKQKMTGRNIQVVESLRLSGGKCLDLIRAGDKYLLISESKEQVGLICELPEDVILQPEAGEQPGIQTPDFKKLLEKAGNVIRKNDRK
ncbi:MAG: flagellar biosynthetic protein FliO [Lachnospiraceae bacterium]|nr:flagellar biosynthetic protein FliO [Lachnospiraceae bacterium]